MGIGVFLRVVLACSLLVITEVAYGESSTEPFGLYDLKCENSINNLSANSLSPRFSWKIASSERDFIQRAYRIEIASSEESLLSGRADVWSSGRVVSRQSILVSCPAAKLLSDSRYYWRVKIYNSRNESSLWSKPQVFYTRIESQQEWNRAQWIAMEHDSLWRRIVPGIHAPLVWRTIGNEKTGGFTMPLLRKEFKVNGKIMYAVLNISGLGHFDCFLNGVKVGNNFMDPGWTKYDKRALYVSFDVTSQLKAANNVIAVMLGNGFYNIPRERYLKQLSTYGAPKMKARLKIMYQDGRCEYICSDTSWRCSASPITFSSIYAGEDYDATLEQSGWLESGFDDSSWGNAMPADYNPTLTPQMNEPLKVMESFSPVRKYRNGKGCWVYDLGQNFSGILEIKVNSKRSQKIILHPAELLNSDSTVNQSASGSPYYFSYTTSAEAGEASWRPRFSYYGFRYVQVEGAVPSGADNPNNLPEIVQLQGLHTRNSAAETGTFSCSNSMINNIYKLIDWSMKSNLASSLTDCPHREKLGWLEVLHLMQNSLQYRFDLAGFYSKVIDDMADGQTEQGLIPSIAPEYVRFADGFEDSPEWGSAAVIAPWTLYRWYGDSQVLTQSYNMMRRYIDYLLLRSNNYIVSYGLGDWFDLGPKTPGYSQLTSYGVTATAMFYHNCQIMTSVAQILEKSNDAQKYRELAGKIRKAYNEKYYKIDEGYYDRNSQTANAISLYMGLVEEHNREIVFKNLCDDIRLRGYALTAGDVGYRYLLQTLTDFGADSVIYKMNTRYDTPGYGWQLAQGATALTESWQAYGFVSNNHCMLGHLMEWLFCGIGGVKHSDSSVAFSEVVIDPRPSDLVKSASTRFRSSYGDIVCDWSHVNSRFVIDVEIPANSSAIVHLPGNDPLKMSLWGVPIVNVEQIKDVIVDKGRVIVKIGSGSYSFSVEE